MRVLAYLVAALVTLPYALLALAFVLFDRAVAGGSLTSFLGVILAEVTWLIPWGLLAVAAGAVVLLALGMHRRSRRGGGAVVCFLALASVVVICVLSSARIGPPELTFLLPCIASAAVAAWLVVTG